MEGNSIWARQIFKIKQWITLERKREEMFHICLRSIQHVLEYTSTMINSQIITSTSVN